MPRHFRLSFMFAAYLDASGKTEDVSKPGVPALALAGYVAPVEAWKLFDKKWRGELLRRFSLKHAHHKDFAQGRGQYLGWSEKKRRRYAQVGCGLINRAASVGVVTAVLLKDYAGSVSSNPKPRSPFMFVAVECFKQIARWAGENKIVEPITYFFETGDGHDSEILQIRKEILARRSLRAAYHFHSLTFLRKVDAAGVPLQSSDWLAWEAAKYLKDTKLAMENARDMRAPLRLLWESGKLITQFYDTERLGKLAAHNRALLEEARRIERLFE